MIKLSKLADYAIVLLTHYVGENRKHTYTARELSEASKLPLPTVSKLLKALSRAQIVVSHRGVSGGYSLAKPAQQVNVVEIIASIEGPIALTECSHQKKVACEHQHACPVEGHWRRINGVVIQALSQLSLADMCSHTHPSTSSEVQWVTLHTKGMP
jgi:FeS assembly SUF system regulator